MNVEPETEGATSRVVADHAVGAFTDDAPWIVDPASMSWRGGVDGLRARAAARVPQLLRVRRFPPARGATIALRLVLTVVPWYVRYRRQVGTPAAKAALAKRLRATFERLGTTFIKVGQLLGSADGMLANEWVQEFKLCRDRVPPESFAHVRQVVEADFGRPLEEIFASFEPTPIAAASVAQVHAARLLDGTEVVVKVQRPRIDEIVARDIATMAWVAALADKHSRAAIANLPAYVELFADTIVEELDFRLEAENMLDIARVLAITDERSVVVPRPHPDLVTRRVLVMERLHGFSTDDAASLADHGIDTAAVFRSLLVSFFEGSMIYGVFHGDLHGGNMVVTPDGRAAIFDFGITGRFTEAARRALLGLMLAATSQDGRGSLRHFRDLGGLPPDVDLDRLAIDIDVDGLMTQNPAELAPDQAALQMRELTNRLVAHGARLPKELFLYMKGNVYLTGAIATMAADVDVFAEIGNIYAIMMEQHGDELASLIDLSTMPDEQTLIDRVQQQLGIAAPEEGMTLRAVQEANSQRQAEIRSAMKQTGKRRKSG